MSKARLLCLLQAALVLLLGAAAALLSGCGGLGAFYGIFIAPLVPAKTIPPEHDMSGRRLLIWVDDFSLAERDALLRRELTEQLTAELLHQQAVESVVDYTQIISFRRRNHDSDEVAIRRLARQCRADEILYLCVDKFVFRHEAGVGYYRPSLTAGIKIVDVDSGKRLWPTAQTHRLLAETSRLAEGSDAALESRLIRRLCADTADNIARWFYPHKAPKPFEPPADR